MAEHSASMADHVEVRPHPTVVRLDDLEAVNAAWLSDSFLLTPEVNGHLKALRQLFGRTSGCGIFLIGHYGCGKSHFLAYLMNLFRRTRPPHRSCWLISARITVSKTLPRKS